jgi:molybdopterin molybdotransferase
VTSAPPVPWTAARAASYAAGQASRPDPVEIAPAGADGLVLAEPLTTPTDLPAFPTSSVDGYAVRGAGPWRVVGQALAGGVPTGLAAGTAVTIATGAMVPDGTDHIIRLEDSTVDSDSRVSGAPRSHPDWRVAGDEAGRGDELLPAGTVVSPAVIGLACSCGRDRVRVVPAPRVAVVVFGDELLTAGPPGAGRVRDSLGPQLPAWLRRLGAVFVPAGDPTGPLPVEDTLPAHIDAIRAACATADVVCTTGGTMHGPVDHLHAALAALDARYVVNTVAVRPGYPMLLAEIPGTRPVGRSTFVAGLPGNPHSAIVGLVSLVVPLLAGLSGRTESPLSQVRLAEPVPGRGDFTHLALVRIGPAATAYPVAHTGSAMLRGLAQADGFAVIEPGTSAEAGATVPFLPLPYGAGR